MAKTDEFGGRGTEQKREGTSNAKEEVIETKQTEKKKCHLTLLITLPMIGHNYGWQTELPLQRLSTARQMMAEVKKQ